MLHQQNTTNTTYLSLGPFANPIKQLWSTTAPYTNECIIAAAWVLMKMRAQLKNEAREQNANAKLPTAIVHV